MIIKNYLLLLLLLLLKANKSNAQAIFLSFGPIFTKSKAISPIINAKEDFSNTDYTFGISFEYFLKHKLSLLAAYSEYGGYTYILFEKGGYKYNVDDEGYVIGKGYSGAKLSRYDFQMAYNVMNKHRKFYLKPSIGIGLQFSKTDGVEIYNTLAPLKGPYYFETEPIMAEVFNTTQITPTFGLKTGFVFWKRLDIGLAIQGVYAAKPYQKMILKYNYKGIPQPDAIYSSSGTGLFYSIGIGYRFAKYIK